MNRYTVPDDEPQLHRTLARVRDATGLPLAFGGPVDTHRQLRLTQFAGSNTGALRGVALDFGLGLGGKAVALRRPLVVNDYARTAAISHHYDHIIAAEGLRAMVAVPVVVRGVVRGVLYGAIRSGEPLGDRVVQSVMEEARNLEQDLAVRDQLNRRLDWLDERTAEPASPQWEVVRLAYAELRVLAADVNDSELRERVKAVCDKLSTVSDASSTSASVPALSPRELDVLACVALGWTNAQVAKDLEITTETVKSYLRTVMRKLDAQTRMEAVVAARRFGLLP